MIQYEYFLLLFLLLKKRFQPDYTSDEINETLTLNTNIGLITFPIIVRIPQSILSACYKLIPRPPWEFRPYCLCLCSLIIVTVLILTLAVFDARRSFDNVNKKKICLLFYNF